MWGVNERKLRRGYIPNFVEFVVIGLLYFEVALCSDFSTKMTDYVS